MSNSFSQEERESLTRTMADLTRLLGTVEDKGLKEKLEENILALCDQLKARLIMDMHRER